MLFERDNIIGVSKYLLLTGCGAMLFLSCSQSSDTRENSETLPVSVSEPVERDFAEIKRNGVLRMITSYSSGSYFLYKGVQVGFEYELLKAFTKENDLALEVVITGPDESPYDLLNSGRGDIIAANYTITPERKQVVEFTRPYNMVDQLIVVSDDLGFKPESISDMEGIPISVRRNSSYYVRLKELKDEGFPVNINIIPEDMDTESVLFQVADGTYEATVADDNIFDAADKYMNGLIKGPLIAESDTIAWAVRKNAPDLEYQLNRFLYKHFRFDEDGVPKRSAFLNVLRKKYFESGNQIADYYSPTYQGEQYGTISPYDNMIREVADEMDVDWVMLTAIAAQESKFNPSSVSWAGAVGIMQVLPRFSEISSDSLYIPEVNIREGAKILASHLDHYAYMDSTNKWSFALAAYNAGSGHLADARRLTIDHNKNPNEWEDVSESLLKLMQRKYYQHARYGFCRGIETVRYVNEIMNRYSTYQTILAHNREKTATGTGVLGLKTFN
ncbi:MAG: transporter substrate-binding domain-containing protein [Gracilimonas sp.]|uniref:transglycosylase SLT domain-containing protein n=1 Tax=Gracilimonas sp. TaxID=1974203 RepID=UPI001B10D9E3|nr:transporter substrate-binding domain-containing protein [Gracilimonas sp.]MBO6585163.1 transporter substrate-binding domain-containing protein [Gracilimonas sp.]MBO6615565.1 transporter substrate-binding domain-containing protein [Gracilimonas sp.]